MSNTPLHLAVIEDDFDSVRQLKESLEDTDFVDELGYTPRELAYLLGKGDCLRILQPTFSPLLKFVPKEEHIVVYYTLGSFLEKRGVAYTPTLRFEDMDVLRKMIKLCPRLLQSQKWGKEVQDLGAEWQEKIFQAQTAHMTVVWTGTTLGYGVLTNENLKAGDFIGEYAGLVRPVSKEMPLVNGYCLEYPVRWPCRERYVIDAKFHGNVLRYINHSDTPNLEGRWALDRGLLHLLFFAAEPIPRGSQLTINYGEGYWEHRKKVVI